MFKNSKLLFWTVEILLLFLVLFVGTKISFLFQPIAILISTLFAPILVSIFLYFLFAPIVDFLERKKVPRSIGILLLYLALILIAVVSIINVFPTLTDQFKDLVNNMPTIVNKATNKIGLLEKWLGSQNYVEIKDLEKKVADYSIVFLGGITGGIGAFFNILSNVTLIILTVPFILFYMFKDGHKFPTAMSRFSPQSLRKEAIHIAKETSETLASYIQGQTIVCIFVGIGTFIGYSIIGLPNALILALVAAVTNIIPYFGPFIGGAPAVIVAILISPKIALFVILVILIVQQIDSNLISPYIMGKKLNIHPLTIILLLLFAGNFAGVLGMVLAVPTYAICKVVIINISRIIKLRKKAKFADSIIDDEVEPKIEINIIDEKEPKE
ncbi:MULTISPECIES: AI-2E family transporter [unclassified Bacillus (in: firmicutes)]|uniref:AI-2E family transporter n=1 Tax=unclassified Bacillus (in: firmicutes) TaxID=185979 RepID=UPI000BEF3329|nr:MULTISPECIES: AI-2E family transporter [unclassified Bacillus (in: firmicutes)]PEJ48743.1 AI-2E family transporter [Bacillus sp. AFS002410]PEK98267.1 AI-2E family transporter [Bacillus sp. AFS017336]